VECLSDRNKHCEHRFYFGYGAYCQHPQSEEILKRALAG
jgi:hypothetical protein